ncbi:MAG: hypothetical protein VZR27_04120 [Acutalibacteraceae bacterium]|nr:hypothetical protein [Acutalibacteraceae bacterium]
MKVKKVVLCILFVIIFVAVWNVLDLMYSTFITKSAYQFGIGDDMLLPLFMAVVLDIPLILRKK